MTSAAAVAAVMAGAAGTGTTNALFSVLPGFDHIADSQAKNQCNQSSNNQIFHKITFFLSEPLPFPVPCRFWQ